MGLGVAPAFASRTRGLGFRHKDRGVNTSPHLSKCIYFVGAILVLTPMPIFLPAKVELQYSMPIFLRPNELWRFCHSVRKTTPLT